MLYSAWVYTLGTQGSANSCASDAAAIRGKLVYQKYNCAACHQVFGLGGYLGPELSTTMSQLGKSEDVMRAFLQYGTARMPQLHLNENEITDVIEYMKYIDKVARESNYNGSPIAAINFHANRN